MLAVAGMMRKRVREDDGDDLRVEGGVCDKKARPTTEPTPDGGDWFPRDSVLGTPTASAPSRTQPGYDSEEERSSSIVSEPGSPQDVSMSSEDDEMEDDLPTSPEQRSMRPRAYDAADPWRPRLRTDRVATPVVAMRSGVRPLQPKLGIKQHIRQRHPQENHAERLEVPSPIDEDEVATPPSAAEAEAAGSRLSLLTVRDVDMDDAEPIPTMSVERVRPSHTIADTDHQLDAAMGMPGPAPHGIFVRKQRQRSGALSGGDSPVRAGPSATSGVRGFSVGFRADCEKCQKRVPGHMNHFY